MRSIIGTLKMMTTKNDVVDLTGGERAGAEEAVEGDVSTVVLITFEMMPADNDSSYHLNSDECDKIMLADDDSSYHLTSNESEDGNNYDVVEDLVLHSCDQLNFPLNNRLFGLGG